MTLYAILCLVILALCLVFIGTRKKKGPLRHLAVAVSSSTGAVKYGATGFLYGLGDDGIPTDNVLVPLKPRVACQKPHAGAQHPNGDAFDVAEQFFAAGGDHIEIYMQDMYALWPYEFIGIEDYLVKVESIARQVLAEPYRKKYVYVPFNEPDNIWYKDNLEGLCRDWKTVVSLIRSIDSGARLAGPNFYNYNCDSHRGFLSFCKENDCLPDLMTWHELQDSFYTDWYNNYDNYKKLEAELDLQPIPVCINEYARKSGDLGFPGKMIQWIVRFENSKVDACRAYWTAAGSLNDLVTRNNSATGDWWLYRWYASLTGNTVLVLPATANDPFQGLAAFDEKKQQVRVVFGGSEKNSDVFDARIKLSGFTQALKRSGKVHVVVRGIDATEMQGQAGFAPSEGPYLVLEGDYPISDDCIQVKVRNLKALSAYYMVVSANCSLSSKTVPGRYGAEYAELDGDARIETAENEYTGTGYVTCASGKNKGSVTYIISIPDNGYYDLRLRYSVGEAGSGSCALEINGELVSKMECRGASGAWAEDGVTAFLQAGINRIRCLAREDGFVLNQDYLEVCASSGPVSVFRADIGAGDPASLHSLEFPSVVVPSAGRYRIVVEYANAEKIGTHEYNNNVVDRNAAVLVNGKVHASGFCFRNTFSWSTYGTTVLSLDLKEGTNRIAFSNTESFIPAIREILVAPAFLQAFSTR